MTITWGRGRILQFDKNWIAKGTWYTSGTRYFIVGCTVAPDGTLWGFDCHDHIAVRATPDGKELPPWDSGRSFGSVSWDQAGNHYFGEYFIGKEIWKGTSAKFLADGTLGVLGLGLTARRIQHIHLWLAQTASQRQRHRSHRPAAVR